MLLEFSRTDVKTVTTCVIKGTAGITLNWWRKDFFGRLGNQTKGISYKCNFSLQVYQSNFWFIVKEAYIWLSIAERKRKSSINNGKLEIHGSFFREGEFVQTSDFSVCSLPSRNLMHVSREKHCREVCTLNKSFEPCCARLRLAETAWQTTDAQSHSQGRALVWLVFPQQGC